MELLPVARNAEELFKRLNALVDEVNADPDSVVAAMWIVSLNVLLNEVYDGRMSAERAKRVLSETAASIQTEFAAKVDGR